MEDSLSPIPNAIEVRTSLPRPNWVAIADWVDANVESDSLGDVWTRLARGWLDRLVLALPSGYAVYESPEFFALVADPSLADRILTWCERSRHVILETLVGVARDEGFGKHVVLAFADADRYYDYITDFYPDEGEFALSGGIFLDVGYGHFAMCMAYGNDHERTIAHELNHAMLRHLPLPLWLNEGVTQFMEDMVLGTSYFMVDHETVRRHKAYWNDQSIHMFWAGDSFFSPDEGQELSYHLAQVLFRNLMSEFPKRIQGILSAANFSDAGNSALVDACGVTLGNRVTQFLGDGSWHPNSDYHGPDV